MLAVFRQFGKASGVTSWVFLASLAIYLVCSIPMLRAAAGDRAKRAYLLTGDEPHYLLLTHSLVTDGDFNLYNNVANRDWRHFTEKLNVLHEWGFERYNALSGGRLRGREHQWQEALYSKHRLGLPLLLAPAYAVGLRLGDRTRLCAILFMIVVAALLATGIFAAAREESGSAKVALACWSATALAAPLLNYSNQIYPDLVAGLLTLCAYRFIRRDGALDVPRTLATALCIAYLPWLNERFIVLAAALFAVWMFRSRRLVTFAVALVPLLPSALLQMLYYDRLFALPFPVNVHQGFSLTAGLRHGLPGLLLDRDNGLLWYAPIYFAGAAGLAVWWRERRAEVFALLAVCLPYYVLVGVYRHWYSVWYPPLRYLAAILPLFCSGGSPRGASGPS